MKTIQSKVLESGPLETLFGSAAAKIMDFMISSQEWDYSESDIARYSDVSTRTVQRELPKLLDYKLVKMVRTVGSAKMYQLDKSPKHKTGDLLEKLALRLAQKDIQKETEKAPIIEEEIGEVEMKQKPKKILA
jgi:predicted AAA+ superfamily ATPase